MYFVALTPTLSRKEREPWWPPYSPLALWERARVRGVRATISAASRVFETVSFSPSPLWMVYSAHGRQTVLHPSQARRSDKTLHQRVPAHLPKCPIHVGDGLTTCGGRGCRVVGDH